MLSAPDSISIPVLVPKVAKNPRGVTFREVGQLSTSLSHLQEDKCPTLRHKPGPPVARQPPRAGLLGRATPSELLPAATPKAVGGGHVR